MECDLSIDVGVDDPCQIIFQGTRKARKPHKCMECGVIINPGESYEHLVGKSTGETTLFAHRTCLTCLSIRKVFFENFFFGFIWENLRDEFDEINWEVPEACLWELTPKAREIVCEMIEEYWKETEEDEEE